MLRKKISLLIAFCLIALSGCGRSQTESVDDWQKADNLGSIEEIEIEEIYSWGSFSDEVLIDQFIQIEEQNTYREINAAVFKALWNYYADSEYKIGDWKTEKVATYTEYKATLNKGETPITLSIVEDETRITSLQILIDVETAPQYTYKYTALAYYILIPQLSKTTISDDLESLYTAEETGIYYTSTNRTLHITRNDTDNGTEIKINFAYKQR